METKNYYPSLNSLLSVSGINEYESLRSFFGNEETFLNEIFIKDFTYKKSTDGNETLYSLKVISKRRLDCVLTGESSEDSLFFVLNPDQSDVSESEELIDHGISAFPVTINYSWTLLRYIRSVKSIWREKLVENLLDTDPKAIAETLFDLALHVLKLTDKQIVAQAINTFALPSDSTVTRFQQFIIDFNNFLTELNAALPEEEQHELITEPTGTDRLGALVQSMVDTMGQHPALSVLAIYILQDVVDGDGIDWDATKKKLNQFFRSLLPTYDVEAYLKNLLLPKFSASLNLNAALEFPRSMLIPVDRVEVDGRVEFVPKVSTDNIWPKVSFLLPSFTFEYHSERGFINDFDFEMGTNTLAMIPKSGLVVDVQKMKIDLRNDRNIPEVQRDGRPASFKGVYIGSVEVYLPKGFSTIANEHIKLKAEELVIGANGADHVPAFGVSGHFFLDKSENTPEGAVFQTKIGSMIVEIDDFDLTLHQNQVQEDFHASGRFILPNVAPQGDSAFTIDFDMAFDGEVYILTARTDADIVASEGVEIMMNEALVVEFSGNGVEKVEGSFHITIGETDPVDFDLLVSYANDQLNLSADNISNWHIVIGPVDIEPQYLALGIGGGSGAFEVDAYITIKGVTDEAGLDKRFNGTYAVNDQGTFVALSSPDNPAKVVGLPISLHSFSIHLQDQVVLTSAGSGALVFTSENNPPVEIGFDIIYENQSWVIEVEPQPFTRNQATIAFGSGADKLRIAIGNDGIESVSGMANISFPMCKDANGEIQTISVAAAYESEILQLNVDFNDNAPEFNLGPLKLQIESGSMRIQNGEFTGSLETKLIIKGVTSDGTADREYDAVLEVASDHVRINLENASTAAQISTLDVELRNGNIFGFGLRIDSFDISFNRTGIVGESSIGGVLLLEHVEEQVSTEQEVAWSIAHDQDGDLWQFAFGLSEPVHIHQVKLIFPQEDALKITLDHTGIVAAEGWVDVVFPKLTKGNVEQPIRVGAEYESGLISLSAAFSGPPSEALLRLELGPLVIIPQSVELAFGNGTFAGSLASVIIIKDVKENSTDSTADRMFSGLLEVGQDDTTIGFASISPQESDGRILGFGMQITGTSIRFNRDEILDFDIAGLLHFDSSDESNTDSIQLGFALGIDQTSAESLTVFKLNVSTDSAIVLDNWNIAFKKWVNNAELPGQFAISFTKEGIIAAALDMKISRVTTDNQQPANAIYLIGAKTEDGFSLTSASTNGLTFEIGKTTIEVEQFGMSFTRGKLSSVETSGIITIEDIKDGDGDKAFNVTLGFFTDHTRVQLAALPDQDNTAKLQGISLELSALDISFNSLGIIEAANNSATGSLTINKAGIEAVLDITFGFSDDGYSILVELEDGKQLIDRDQLQVTLTALGFSRNEDGLDFTIGGIIETDIAVPALNKVIPKIIDINQFSISHTAEGRKFDWNVSMTWEGGTTLIANSEEGYDIYIPLDGLTASLGEFLKIDKLRIQLEPGNGILDSENKVVINARLYGLQLNIGPVTAVADGMGLRAIITQKPEDPSGLFGFVDVDLKFIPPMGLGIYIDGGAISGGGYLNLDYENQRYYGFLSLEIGSFGLDAIGVYNKTEDGYSFLAMIDMALPNPVPLVFGFYLQSVGGIVGLHRGLNADALRDGIRTGALDNILFPENLVDNFNAVLANMETFFPMQHGRHSFAVLFEMTYGTTDMVKLELGLFLSLPQPVIIAIGGTVKINMPENSGELIRLNCAFVGIYKQETKTISFDAHLYDSVLSNYMTLEGDMSARFGWGENKMFMITVGGFHPQFVPDKTWKLPAINRMALLVLDEEETKVFVEAYMAVTSNTFQIGARCVVTYQKGNVGLLAYAGFDALFQFKPFHFIVTISAGAEISYKGNALLGVGLSLDLSGPGIWNAKGLASVTIICFDVKVDFDKTWGEQENDSLPAINVLDLLVQEIQKDTSWRTNNQQDNAVTLKPVDSENESALVLGAISNVYVSQLLVPLGFTLGKFGENPIAGPRGFYLHDLKLGGTLLSTESIEDYFAPSQFKNLTDQQKLTGQSYEQMNSGIAASNDDGDIEIPFFMTQKEIDYEVSYKDGDQGVPNSVVDKLNGLSKLDFVRGGAFGRHRSFRANKRKQNKNTGVRVVDTHYRLVNKNDLQIETSSVAYRSKAMAQQELENLRLLQPQLAKDLRVAPKSEYGKYLAEVEAALTPNDIDK
jgi:hypothetical protein